MNFNPRFQITFSLARLVVEYSQMTSGLDYCRNTDANSFELSKFIQLFWNAPGLKRSIDKIFEIVVYSLFQVLVDELDVSVEISGNRSFKRCFKSKNKCDRFDERIKILVTLIPLDGT